jgi:hypothetical protein
MQPVYRQNRLVFVGWGFYCSYFQSNGFRPVFTEFDRFFQKLTESEGADFLVSASFLNTDNSPSSNIQYSSREIYREEPWTKT